MRTEDKGDERGIDRLKAREENTGKESMGTKRFRLMWILARNRGRRGFNLNEIVIPIFCCYSKIPPTEKKDSGMGIERDK